MKYFDLVKQFVDQEFTRAGRADHELPHLSRTLYWVLQLKPDADEAMQIAGYAHDIERAFRDKSDEELKHLSFKDPFFLKLHPEKGAQIIGDFLAQNQAPQELIDRVKMLISAHEIGGNDDQNILQSADSISFLEDQGKVDRFIARMKNQGKDAIIEKFQWMYERAAIPEAKKIIEPFYREAMRKLEHTK